MSKEAAIEDQEVTMDRRQEDRREEITEEITEDTVQERPQRRKKQRRRQIDPTTCERDYNDKEIEFMHALDEYKRNAGRMFPTCSEVLEVIRDLGYVQLTEEQRAMLQADEFDDDAELASDIDGEDEDEFAETEEL